MVNSMWKLPTNYTVYRVANNGNQVTAIKSTSTAAKPKLIILDRSDAVYNSATGQYSVPELRVRVLYGTVDTDGNPRPERLLADCSFRTPIGSEGDHEEWFADFIDLVSESDFLDEGIKQHMFPTCCSEAPEDV